VTDINRMVNAKVCYLLLYLIVLRTVLLLSCYFDIDQVVKARGPYLLLYLLALFRVLSFSSLNSLL